MEREDGRGRCLTEVGCRKVGKIVYVVFKHVIFMETGAPVVSQVSVNKSEEVL